MFKAVDDNNSGTLDHYELPNALKVLNGELISDKEVEYTIRILGLMKEAGISSLNPETGEHEITFEQFSVIAALSERVAALDKHTKKQLDALNFDALEKKMLKAKEMFDLNETYDKQGKPTGEIPLDQLSIILKAGRIADEHEQEVRFWMYLLHALCPFSL